MSPAEGMTEDPGFVFHVLTGVLAQGFFLASTLFALIHLLRGRENFDRWSCQAARAGLPLLTLSLLAGSVMARRWWGSAWNWEPKAGWALVTWLYFAAYLRFKLPRRGRGPGNARSSRGGAAVMALLGGVVVGVALLSNSGLHSFLR